MSRPSPLVMDAEDLNLLLGLYLSKIDDTDVVDDGSGKFPADSVLWQLLATEIGELSQIGSAGHWECVIAETTEFIIGALVVATNETPREARIKVAELLDTLRRDIRGTLKDARLSHSRSK